MELKPKNSRFELQPVEISLLGYELMTSSLQESHDRGCALYVDKNLNPKICSMQHCHKDAVWCEIHMIKNVKIIVGCV